MKRFYLLSLMTCFLSPGYADDFLKKGLDLLEEDKNIPAEEIKQEARQKEPEMVLPIEPAPASWSKLKTVTGFTCQIADGFHIEENTETNFTLLHESNAGVAVVVMDYDADFPADYLLQTYRETAKQDVLDNFIEAYEEINLGAARGVLRVENPPESEDEPRRITIQAFAGTKGIHIVASARNADFKRLRATLSQMVRSIVF